MYRTLAIILTILMAASEYSGVNSLLSDKTNDDSLFIESVTMQDIDELYKTYRQKIEEGTAELSMYSDICLEDYYYCNYENAIDTGLKGLKKVGWDHQYQYHNTAETWMIGSLLYYIGVSYMEKDDPDNQMAIEYLTACAECFSIIDNGEHESLSNNINIDYNLYLLYKKVGETEKAAELSAKILNNSDYQQIYQSVKNNSTTDQIDTEIAAYYQFLLNDQNNQE